MKHLLIDSPCHQRSAGEVEGELAAARRMQWLLTEISSRFVTQPAGKADTTIEESQQLICETLGLDRSTLWQSSDDASGMALTHFWQRTGSVPLRRNYVTNGNLPWAESQVRQGEAFHFSSLFDLPPAAALDAENLRLHGTKSNATFPLVADGKVFGALAFACLTAERRWTEDEIAGLKLIAQVFGHVISRGRAEERAEQLRDEIQRSSRASMLGELAAALAHEINQPLTTILGNAQAARRFLTQGNADPVEIRAILDDIIRDDKRAGEIVKNLRELLGGVPTRKNEVCINEIVRDVAVLLHSEVKAEHLDLELDLARSLPRIKAVRVEIQQILSNLIENAFHAMVGTPLEDRRILVQTRQVGNGVTVLIRDHGCGIPQQHIDRIFEPFHTTRPDGLGMGLAICRRIAEAHGGSISASNHKAGGAEFSFSLPSHQPDGR